MLKISGCPPIKIVNMPDRVLEIDPFCLEFGNVTVMMTSCSLALVLLKQAAKQVRHKRRVPNSELPRSVTNARWLFIVQCAFKKNKKCLGFWIMFYACTIRDSLVVHTCIASICTLRVHAEIQKSGKAVKCQRGPFQALERKTDLMG